MPKLSLKPFWCTSDKKTVRLYQGDVIAVLKRMKTGSVQMVVTSPPYWGLRDYGTADWEGGDPECDHKGSHQTRGNIPGTKQATNNSGEGGIAKGKCPKCGAKRIDEQIGSEATPDEFVEKMVEVFREVRRVLRDDGTIWINLGDSYGSGGNLVGGPWRVALALQADGWVLRQDIIWSKPSPMPESVRNRCTKSHEYIFLLTKVGSGYFYDAEAVREKANREPHSFGWTKTPHEKGIRQLDRADVVVGQDGGRNKRSVWNVASQSYEGAHFATFPEKLIEPCILAGTSEKGCCSKCRAPWKRVVEMTEEYQELLDSGRAWRTDAGKPDAGKLVNRQEKGHVSQVPTKNKTTGWEAGCKCEGAKIVPCVVLDPFCGSGTTQVVSLAAGRYSIGIDLSEDYLRDNAIIRIEGALLSRPKLAHLAGKETKRFGGGKKVTKKKKGKN